MCRFGFSIRDYVRLRQYEARDVFKRDFSLYRKGDGSNTRSRATYVIAILTWKSKFSGSG